jgi:6-phosphofructokinase 1
MVGIVNGQLVAVDIEDALSRKRALNRELWELAAILAI